ncbi:hypothetical protein [Methanobacterium ferruginis]|jgi:hypothetical protein|uniref:hypothetical protein n=1 Tax=Methanobacterium ferruginis TaxID=710191 RepID=UPI00257297FE|nr:hypothetical protein [Methanobacterium ferruginis]BDZ68520.1 hypothetical protein GCM10025860_19680 [Methanobacterium ferruginis]
MGSYITTDQCASLNLDFMISILFLLLILGSIASVAEGRMKTVQQGEEAAEARLLSEEIAQAIEETYLRGEGHEITLKTPTKLKGSDYIVQVNQSGVLVRVKGRCGYSFSYSKQVSNLDGTQDEVIMLPGRSYTLQNVKDNNHHRVVIF